jgi:hypothetical protein
LGLQFARIISGAICPTNPPARRQTAAGASRVAAVWRGLRLTLGAIRPVVVNQTIFDTISALIDSGAFLEAENATIELLEQTQEKDDGSDVFVICKFNIAGFLVDIAHSLTNREHALNAVELFESLESRVEGVIDSQHYFYNLANAKCNIVEQASTFDLSFSSIETLVEAKNDYWKSIKEASKTNEEFPEQYVNLANCLKRQFRFSEALWYYDNICGAAPGIAQSWINRSEALLMLNTVSNSYSAKMLHEISSGYNRASRSKAIPPRYASYYGEQAERFRQNISESDHEETQKEFQELSEYRKYCCRSNLTLSEHGLYCSCAGSARDNLTIPLTSTTVGGAFVPQMEAVLNRLKSEFSMARRCYFEYAGAKVDTDLIHEECFTDLETNECLGLDFEKLRTAFRLCFGIMDKIGLAICEHHSLKPQNGMVYFQNFWQLSRGNRREQFEAIKTPGLLALYSIATDLNEHKDGEWRDFKRLRNAMEHGFLVITNSGDINDTFGAYELSDDVEIVDLNVFEKMVEQMLQLTRSAIFSFVFHFREKGLKESVPTGLVVPLQRVNLEK